MPQPLTPRDYDFDVLHHSLKLKLLLEHGTGPEIQAELEHLNAALDALVLHMAATNLKETAQPARPHEGKGE